MIVLIIAIAFPLLIFVHAVIKEAQRDPGKERYEEGLRKQLDEEARLLRIKQETKARERGRLEARRDFYEKERQQRKQSGWR